MSRLAADTVEAVFTGTLNQLEDKEEFIINLYEGMGGAEYYHYYSGYAMDRDGTDNGKLQIRLEKIEDGKQRESNTD